MRKVPERDTTTVVLLGPFSPRMFHPLWLDAQGIIGKQEAINSEVTLVHDEFTQFITPRGVSVEVQPQRFAIASDVVPDDCRDMALALFSGALAGTPIAAIGLNRTVHFNVGSPERQHQIGLRLAPRAPWGTWGKKMADGESAANRSGLLSLKLQQNRNEDEPPGYVQVRIEPSNVIRLTGIYLEINNHYSTQSIPPEAGDASAAVRVLTDQWTAANACADEIIDQIMSLPTADAN